MPSLRSSLRYGLGPTSRRSACHSGSSTALTAVSFIRRTEIGCVGGDPLGQPQGRGQDVVPRDDAVDQAPALGVLAGDVLAGQEHLQRDAHGDPLGQDDGAEVGAHADRGLGQAELDARCCDAEVAGQGELEPAGDGRPLQRGDDRHGRLGDHLEQRAGGPVHRRAEVLAALVALADLLEVEPGAERGAVPGEDDRADVAVLAGGQQLLDQVGLQR